MPPARPLDALRDRARAARRRWRRERPDPEAGPGAAYAVGVAATVTAEPLCPYLGVPLLDLGLAPRLEVAPFGQLLQVAEDPTAALSSTPDALLWTWRLEDVAGEALHDAAEGRAGATEAALDAVDQLARGLARLRQAHPGLLLTTSPSYPWSPSLEAGGLAEAATLGPLFAAVTARWRDAVQALDGVEVVDLEDVWRPLGTAATYDPRSWYLYRQPYTEAAWALLGDRVARHLAVHLRPARKVLALDCDGTLWGGVVGEDGLAGIALGQDFPGRAYRDLQRRARALRARGVLLVLLSKNAEADVLEVFDRHDAMVLTRDDLAGWRVDWQDKAANLRALAAELGLGVDSFVFVDDSPIEVARMQAALPEVLSILLPEDPARIGEVLDAAHAFDRGPVTAEDRARTEAMQAARARRQAQAEAADPEAFEAQLEVEVEVFEVEPAHLDRVAQLISKTNQFNLTTRRRTRDEVAALVADPDHRVLAARVRDRFGEYGLTGVAVVATGVEAWAVDTFLLSCRVLGRGAEHRLMDAVVARARAAQAQAITACFVPSPRNQPAAAFLPGYGFQPDDAGPGLDRASADHEPPPTWWRLPLGGEPDALP